MYVQQPAYRNTALKNKRNIIRVSGLGKVVIQPDTAEITLGASTEDAVLEAAQKKNTQIIEGIILNLREIGIPNEQIQTKNYSIFPHYDYIEGKQIFRGYKVEHLLLISVNPIEKAGLAVDTAVKNGANIVSSLVFSAEHAAHYEKQALSLAVIDAYKKADVIAKTLRVQLFQTPIMINEIVRNHGDPIPMQNSLFLKSASITPIQSGTMEIIGQVEAEFEYFTQ
ncbi:SIMPL domain-containing protein [Bacillus sp. S/N-304-OC-R1]|uniref:SIMPL domain-containing protein n=1 Tax=Bacillus sp. S/N-304-OC-R1 TaxID=2758034 RepID=UPI001C8DB7AE|nr:SIMPL domain-containing protein [Bacillus sp. S/N-304-OC-R1]MBY0122429.1 SIMPL domain-containing protein [Bacillus sp. S/N-304-OC-R1]